jgi:hypothetical protein
MRLICFGDSWTAGHGVEKISKYKEVASPPVFIEKLRNQNSWPRWVADKMDIQYVNMGVCGYGNRYILRDLLSCIGDNFINEDDIIIVMFSYPYRYVKDNNDIIRLFWEMEKVLGKYKHFYFNSFYPTFKDEDFDTSNLPETFINPNGCVSDVLKEYENKNDVSVWEYESRRVWNDKIKFWEGDYHPNSFGYKLIADYIYSQIKDKI